jgi:hypothetical protein
VLLNKVVAHDGGAGGGWNLRFKKRGRPQRVQRQGNQGKGWGGQGRHPHVDVGGERGKFLIGFGVWGHGGVAVPTAPLDNCGERGAEVDKGPGAAAAEAVPSGGGTVGRGEGAEEAYDDGGREKRTLLRPRAEKRDPGQEGSGEVAEELGEVMFGGDNTKGMGGEVTADEASNLRDAEEVDKREQARCIGKGGWMFWGESGVEPEGGEPLAVVGADAGKGGDGGDGTPMGTCGAHRENTSESEGGPQ